jgi:hypothetical protein
MFDLALEELDLFGRQVEQGVDAVVQVGFGVGQGARQVIDGRAVLGRSGFGVLAIGYPGCGTVNTWQ